MAKSTSHTIARPLTLALGATTAMWICAYASILFSGKIGGEILFVLSVLCLFQAGRHATTTREGAFVGFISALLNLLLIGSIVGGKTQSELFTSGIIWAVGLVIGSIILLPANTMKMLDQRLSGEFIFDDLQISFQ